MLAKSIESIYYQKGDGSIFSGKKMNPLHFISINNSIES